MALPAASDRNDSFDLRTVKCNVTVLKIEGLREHVRFDDGTQFLQLELTGGTLLDGPIDVRYDLRGFSALPHKLAALNQLMSVHHHGVLPLSRGLRSARWLLALQAWDLIKTGASYRDVAIDLYGLAPDTRDWRVDHEHIRNRVRRLVNLAEAMVSGGYLRILLS